MIRLYFFATSATFRIIVKIFAAIFVLGFTAERLGVPPQIIGLPFYFLPILAFVFSKVLLGPLVPWFGTLPFAKRKYLLLAAALCLTSVLAACVLSVVGSLSLYQLTGHSDLFASGWLDFKEAIYQLRSKPWTVSKAAIVVSILNFSAAFSIVFGINPNARLNAGIQNRQNLSKKEQIRALVILVAILAAIPLWHYFDSGLTYFILFGLVSCVVLPASMAAVLGVPKWERKSWRTIGLLVLMVETVGISMVTVHELRVGNAEEAAKAIRFLGFLSGRVSPERLATILADDIGADEVKWLGARMLASVSGGHELRAADQSALSFKAALASKSKVDRLFAASHLFDLKTISVDQIRFIFDRAMAVRADEDVFYFTYFLINESHSNEEIASFLGMDNQMANFYALAYIRFHPAGHWIEPVRSRLAGFHDSVKPWGMMTLSELSGKHWTWNDFHSLSQTGSSISFAQQDCSQFKKEQIATASEGLINFCIRNGSLGLPGGTQQYFDNSGWVTVPLKGQQKDRVERFFSRDVQNQRKKATALSTDARG